MTAKNYVKIWECEKPDRFTLLSQNYQHDRQDWAGRATESETMPKIKTLETKQQGNNCVNQSQNYIQLHCVFFLSSCILYM